MLNYQTAIETTPAPTLTQQRPQVVKLIDLLIAYCDYCESEAANPTNKYRITENRQLALAEIKYTIRLLKDNGWQPHRTFLNTLRNTLLEMVPDQLQHYWLAMCPMITQICIHYKNTLQCN
ncbi:MAG: hypothetical protein EBX41_10450 [Chitinophagia bacterium]|nr:hypothetical protein [Chitinophagia bacterium]